MALLATSPVFGVIVYGTQDQSAEDELPHISEDGQRAQALQYVHDGEASEERRNTNEYSYNCRFYPSSTF
mgnify:CR=1 FL=1